MEGFLKLCGMVLTGLILWGVLMLLAGGKPKECPPHICYPKDRIVSAAERVEQRIEERKRRALQEEPALTVHTTPGRLNGWR